MCAVPNRAKEGRGSQTIERLERLARRSVEDAGKPIEEVFAEWGQWHNDWLDNDEYEWLPYEETWYPLAHGVLWLASRATTDRGRADRLEQALGVICSQGVPSHLTAYGSVRAIAAFAIGKTDDPFYRDGEKLLNAAVSVCADSRKEEEEEA